MAEKKRVFYGWWIVVVLSIACFTMSAHPFGIILKDLMAEFNSTRGLVSLSLSISTIASGICGLFIGKLIIKKSPKKFLLGGVVLG